MSRSWAWPIAVPPLFDCGSAFVEVNVVRPATVICDALSGGRSTLSSPRRRPSMAAIRRNGLVWSTAQGSVASVRGCAVRPGIGPDMLSYCAAVLDHPFRREAADRLAVEVAELIGDPRGSAQSRSAPPAMSG